MSVNDYEFLVIDFETVDPYLDRKLGSGWVYKDIKVLGCAFYYPNGKTDYIVTKTSIINKLQKTKTLIVFNGNYDIGVLKMWGMDISKYTIIDVLIISKYFDSTRLSYNLDTLSKDYLGSTKSDEPLGELAIELGLVKGNEKSIKVAKRNMDKLQAANKQLVAEYAKQDALLTFQLYEYFMSQEDMDFDIEFYSDLLKCMIENRARGVRIDLMKLLEVEANLQLKLVAAQRELNEFNNGEGVNSNSSKQLGQLLIRNGINVKVTDKDNYKCDKEALEEMDSDIARAILRVRKLRTLKNNFIDKIIEAQRYTIRSTKSQFGIDHFFGIIYPEIHILGAAATGRCSAKSPNIQQIPSRDIEYAKLIRGIISPDENYKYICSADYSAQEPRLIVNDAFLMKCKDAIPIIQQFRKDPNTDFHQIAADLMNVERSLAKTIGLGLLYGMGIKKLAVQIEESVDKASFYRDLYFDKLPFMKAIIDSMSTTLRERGYIKTLLGNRLRLDKSTKDEEGRERTFEYKAINKRTQGNAANQTNMAMVKLYRAGIQFMFPVHDEIVASVNTEEEALKIKEVMERAIPLNIPSVVDINLGENWGECK